MNSIHMRYLMATGGALVLWSAPAQSQTAAVLALAQPASSTFLDLTAAVGYSSSPFLRTSDSQSSIFGRASARGVYLRRDELSSTSLSAFVEGTSYFNDYGLKSIFSLNGSTAHQVSEHVNVHGSAGVSGDLSGQLSNRFLYVPPLPEVPDPSTEPPPSTIDDPDSFDFSGRHYRFHGQAGTSIVLGTRSSIGLSGGLNRSVFTNAQLNDHTTLFARGRYNLTLSERTDVGAMLSVRRTNFDDSGDGSTVINPAVTIRTRLSETWDASAAVGVSFARSEQDGLHRNSTNLSLLGSICNTSETERLCGRVSRNSQSSASAALVNTTSAGVDWFKKLDETQTIQLSASIARYISEDIINPDRKNTYLRAAASYSRALNMRMSAGADIGFRSVKRQNLPDTNGDISGSVFVRYRLGDLG